MRYDKLLEMGILVVCSVATADVRTPAPPDPGPPEYTFVQRMLDGSPYVIHDDEWAAIAFERDANCVPADFNLLDTVDFALAFPGGPPRAFLCPLTVSGFANWKNGPLPSILYRSRLSGTASAQCPCGS
jgi:hypothetical protein